MHGEMRNRHTSKIFVGTLKEKDHHNKRRCKRDDDIKVDLIYIGYY
jgi:hypothetical protein